MEPQFVPVWWLSGTSLGSIIRQEITPSGAQQGPLTDMMHNSKSATPQVYVHQADAHVIRPDCFFKLVRASVYTLDHSA